MAAYNHFDIFASPRPEENQDDSGVLGSLKNSALSAIGFLGNVLDTPGSTVRGLLHGDIGRTLSGIIHPSERVSGKELAGIDDNPDSWLDDAGGIATEIVTDPLFFLSGIGRGATSTAGKIAEHAGLMPQAIRSGEQLAKGAAELGTKATLRQVAEQSPEALQKILTSAEGHSKPGLFKRGITALTGHEFENPEYAKAIQEGLSTATGTGGIVDEPLRAGVARFHVPFTDIGMNVGDSLAPRIDMFSDKFRYGNWLDALPTEAKIPFTDKTIPINPLKAVEDVANPNEGLPGLAQYNPDPGRKFDFNPVRSLASLFSKDARGSFDALGQLTGQTAGKYSRANEESLARASLPDRHGFLQLPAEMRDTPEAIRAIQNFVRSKGEDVSALNFLIDGTPYSIPEDFAKGLYERGGPNLLNIDREAGLPTNELDKDYGYGIRQKKILPGMDATPRDSTFPSNVNNAGHTSQLGRKDIFGSNPDPLISAMSLDPMLTSENLAHLHNVSPDEVGKSALQHLFTEHGYETYDQAEHALIPKELASLKGQVAKLSEIPPSHIATQELLDAGFHPDQIANTKMSELWNSYRKPEIDDLTSQIASKEQRLGELADQYERASGLQKELQNTKGAYLNSPHGYFDSPFMENYDTRLNRTARATGEAQALQDSLAGNIIPGAPGEDKRLMSLNDAAVQLKMGSNGNATEGAVAQLAKRLGRELDPLGNSIPRDVVESLARVQNFGKNPQEITGFVKAIDKMTSFFKTYALMRPAFHVRNGVSGQVENMMQGLFDAFSSQTAGKLMAGESVPGLAKHMGWAMTDEEAARKIVDEAFVHKVIPSHVGEISDIPGVANNSVAGAFPGGIPVGKGITLENAKTLGNTALDKLSDPMKTMKDIYQWTKDKYNAGEMNLLETRGVQGEESKSVFSKAQEKANHVVEGYNRLGAFVDGLRQGFDPAELAQRIRGSQLDYTNMSTFERNVMRRVAPFYSFARQEVPHVVDMLAHHPGGPYGQLVRGMSDLQDPNQILPDQLKSGLAIPLGTNDQGAPRYLTGLGLMPEDSFRYLGGALGGGGFGTELTSQLSPLIKGPLEMATGRSMFQDRELRDQDPVIGRIISNIFGGEPMDTRKLDQIVMNTIPTPFTVLKSATDTRKDIGTKSLNTLTGVKVTDVPPKTQESIARGYLQDSLRDSGARKYEQYVLSKDDLAKLPPDEQKRAMAIQGLLKDLAERAKRRVKAV